MVTSPARLPGSCRPKRKSGRMWTVLRLASVAALGFVTAACDPMQTRGVTLAPTPAAHIGSLQDQALAIGNSVAMRHGLRPEATTPFSDEVGWQCYADAWIRLCAKPISGELQFHFAEPGFSFSPRARAVWEEVTAEMSAEFGPDAVRECRFVRRPDPEAPDARRAVLRHVCVPLQRAAGE